jgi:hypothetical protein
MLQLETHVAAGRYAATKAPSHEMPRLLSQWTKEELATYVAACNGLAHEIEVFAGNMATVHMACSVTALASYRSMSCRSICLQQHPTVPELTVSVLLCSTLNGTRRRSIDPGSDMARGWQTADYGTHSRGCGCIRRARWHQCKSAHVHTGILYAAAIALPTASAACMHGDQPPTHALVMAA